MIFTARIAGLLVIIWASSLSPVTWAQAYPNKPIRLIIPFGPGGVSDIVSRLVARKLTDSMGQPVVVESRPGASGTIAGERVAKSPPDGYTLLMMVAGDTVLPALRANLPYDIERDFVPISLVAIAPQLLVVHASVPARSIKDVIRLARMRPGKLTYGSAGVGSAAHLAMELVNSMTKLTTVHVPYKGGGESAIATATGQVDMSFVSVIASQPLVEARKVKPIAVSTFKRVSSVPSIPTINESGLPGYDQYGWNGLIAPAGVPREIIMRLNAVIIKAVASADIKESYSKMGLEPRANTPEEYATFIRNEIVRNTKLVKGTGLKAE